MATIGYIRVSTEEQDLFKQEHLLLKYAQEHSLQIDDFIKVEISSRRSSGERRIDELVDRLERGDILLVAELSRLGRDMVEVINLINGVQMIFVRQPELSTSGAHGKLLLAIYSYFAEAEREFISVRTKQGLAAARTQGKLLGRPKGTRNKNHPLDDHKDTIKRYLKLGLALNPIRQIINSQLEESVSYAVVYYYVRQNPELLSLWKRAKQ